MLRSKFVELGGDPIVSEYYCVVAYGGCAMTSSGRLLAVLNTYVHDLVLMEETIRQTARDAYHVFAAEDKSEPRQDIADTLYSVMTRVLATADICASSSASSTGRDDALASVRAEWALARRRTSSLIQREARFEYFGGVLMGAVICLVFCGLLGAVAAANWSAQISTPSLLAATLAGTIGAVVSVAQRMASGDLLLDYTASRRQKRLLGAARPFVGATFAAMVQFALLGGLLTMQGPDDTQDTPASFAFFALAGFAAGFSERLATDILERAGAVLANPAQQAQSSGAGPTTAQVSPGGASTPPPVLVTERSGAVDATESPR
jgi:hypothetical protein